MGNAAVVQNRTYLLRCFYRTRTNKYRLLGTDRQTLDFIGDNTPLLRRARTDTIWKVLPPQRSVQRNLHYIKSVYRANFGRDFACRTGHAGQPNVAPEQALVGQPRQGLSALRRFTTFLD